MTSGRVRLMLTAVSGASLVVAASLIVQAWRTAARPCESEYEEICTAHDIVKLDEARWHAVAALGASATGVVLAMLRRKVA